MTDFVNTWNTESFLTYPVGPLGLIAMPGTEEIGKKVNSWLKKWRDHTEESMPGDMRTTPGAERQDFLINVSCPRFGNGEGKGMIKESIRGYDIYILCDVGAYSETFDMFGRQVPLSPDDHFMNLKRIIAAISGKAKRVSVIMPMLYEGRQHRRASRESLDCAMALQELERMGVNNIITFDAHDPRVQNAIPTAGFESIMPSYQIFKALLKKDKTLHIDKDHMMIVSPDEGAMSRCIYYSSILGLDLGMFYKRRDYSVIVNGKNPIVAHEFLGNDVSGKDVIIVDDMISSGESMFDIAKQLKEKKASRIFIFSTFGLFVEGFEKFDKYYSEGYIDKVFTTNLVYAEPELLEKPWYCQVNMAKYLAMIIDNLNHDNSISEFLDPADRINKLMDRHRAELAGK